MRALAPLALAPLALAALACSSPTSTPTPPSPKTSQDAAPKTAVSSATRSAALDAVFRDALTAWVIGINGDQSAPMPALPKDAPPAIGAPFAAVLEAARDAVAAPEAHVDQKSDALADAVSSLNRALLTANLDYALDSTVLTNPQGRLVLLFAFALTKHRPYRGGDGQRFVVHWATRLDRVGYRYQLLGFTARARDPLILPRVIDEQLIGDVLPLIADARHVGTTSRRLDEAIQRSSAKAVIDIAGEPATRLADLVASRRALFAAWNERFSRQGVGIALPTTRHLDWPWKKQLASRVPSAELERLGKLEADLGAPKVAAAHALLLRAFLEATEHHEIQHHIDFATGPSAARLTAAAELDEDGRAYVAREVSAQLAEMARHPRLAPITLGRTVRRSLAVRQNLERVVGRTILGLLSSKDAPLSGEELEVTALELLETSGPSLAQKARRGWLAAFGSTLLDVRYDAGVHGEP